MLFPNPTCTCTCCHLIPLHSFWLEIMDLLNSGVRGPERDNIGQPIYCADEETEPGCKKICPKSHW